MIVLVLYFAAGLPLQMWSYAVSPLPHLNYGPAFSAFLAYGIAAPLVASLLWRKSPRARLAAYVFLTFDVLRSIHLGHWVPMALDIVILLYFQTPAMRGLYPSMWSRRELIRWPWNRR